MKLTEHIVIRPPTGDEWPFIHDTWLRSYCIEKKPRDVRIGLWMGGHKRVVHHLITRGMVAVAELKMVPGEALGWCCWSEDTLHYCYVKRHYRGKGVGKALVVHSGADKWCSHHTRHGDSIIPDGCEYDPWRLAIVAQDLEAKRWSA